MLSSSALFGKWCIRPALAEIVPNRTLMIRSKAFLLCFVGPHDPTMQGFIELARPDQTLTDPVIETPTWDCQRANQLGWPPFTRQARDRHGAEPAGVGLSRPTGVATA